MAAVTKINLASELELEWVLRSSLPFSYLLDVSCGIDSTGRPEVSEDRVEGMYLGECGVDGEVNGKVAMEQRKGNRRTHCKVNYR